MEGRIDYKPQKSGLSLGVAKERRIQRLIQVMVNDGSIERQTIDPPHFAPASRGGRAIHYWL